ncbi:MAG TPA: TonB-dependent receptor plug domain-containing protein [Bacteroidales bacterium]|jgi:hypothetical protein|nr:TonB-dependent receptor plug domain-containing protein [Bacteroidales bacterium]HRT14031.1 TonB-dependent receptor plug domain-containing protein [Bacteroidales bacterium]HXK73674.1 TonB-dependent receptor plug domain-containing protein [Bacteroidales bacterium]
MNNFSHFFFFIFLNLCSLWSFAQQYSISGNIIDAHTAEKLTGAYISFQDTNNLKEPTIVVSSTSGSFSLSLDVGYYKIRVYMFGYEEYEKIIFHKKNEKYTIQLIPKAILADEVVVTTQRSESRISSIDVGKMEMEIGTIKSLPALFGEVDILKAIQLLPGVMSGGEGNSGFYVRGGTADQNLILLDDATIYSPGHLFGFFSVFNPDAVKSVDVVKSGMPAYYGGRLASIIDVVQQEGNMKRFQVDGGIGLIFSRLTVQGPIKKEKCSFSLSGRRTYIDFLIQPFLKKGSPLKGTDFYFYDLNAKLDIVINAKHRLYFSSYYGNDVYGFKSFSGSTFVKLAWGNAVASAKWNYAIKPNLNLNTSFNFSNYDFSTKMGMDIYEFNILSGIRDYSLRSDLSYRPVKNHSLTFGMHHLFHTFFPNNYKVETGELSQISLPKSKPYYAYDLALYANDEYDIIKWLKLNVGLRYTHFEHIGPFTRYILDSYNNIVDSIEYKAGKRVKQFNHVEPRLAVRFLIDSNTSIKSSFTLNYQYIHQVSLATISLPTDVWMPSNDIIKPQVGTQVTLGLFRNFYNNMFESYIDFYYKDMKNLIEYKDGLDFMYTRVNPDQMYTFGKGWSYGVEFFIEKKKGRFTGFIAYTLATTKRKFEDLNFGKVFYAKYDRRHDLAINLSYEIIRNKLTASAVWVYASGNTMTIPIGYYFFAGNLMVEYSERNAFRLPPYHRLDLSLNWTFVKTKKFESSFNLSVYNVYNRQNPFFVFFETKSNVSQDFSQFDMQSKAYQMSLFPILPTISWNFSF